jgi:hypothetical protein
MVLYCQIHGHLPSKYDIIQILERLFLNALLFRIRWTHGFCWRLIIAVCLYPVLLQTHPQASNQFGTKILDEISTDENP